MRAVQIARAGAPLELLTRETPEAGAGQVRVRVQACGVCHSDSMPKEGRFPGIRYPIVPGHEIVGVVDALGGGVTAWRIGQRVGIGWYGGHCGVCRDCRRGDFLMCVNHRISGITQDGGYAEYTVVPAEALAAVPDALGSAEAAPLLCAGVTTFNALRNSGARAGDVVAILGMGGLGHLGVQFAAKMGFHTVAIARGADKAQFAAPLGAHRYIDSRSENVAQALSALGGAKVVLATVTNADAMTVTIDGLGRDGVLLVVGAPAEPLKVTAAQLIGGRRVIKGWASGAATDSEDTLAFSALAGVRPVLERYPLERAAEAYERMMSGAARFRVVLETGA